MGRARHSCARRCRACSLNQRHAAPQNFTDGAPIRSYHSGMDRNVAIIGAGVSGLTCGIVFAEGGYRTSIFAKDTGQQTTSSVAAAVWFPYHVKPAERVIPLALETYNVLVHLALVPGSGVSMIQTRHVFRPGELQIPVWSFPLGPSFMPCEVENGVAGGATTLTGSLKGERTGSERIKSLESFKSGFSLRVPLTDTTIYLDYLGARFRKAGG